MSDNWMSVFKDVLGRTDRSLVGELADTRNAWAHDHAFSSDDTLRALDTTKRLLISVSATEQADAVDKIYRELHRTIYSEQARTITRKTTPVEGAPSAGLKAWRDVVTPHRDVASGQYQQAEFAADLAQVHRGEGESEYSDPIEFFRRTYLTEGLSHLLERAMLRITGKGGDPVVELQTNFGGGKTHSMLALYHLFGEGSAQDLTGVDEMIAQLKLGDLPKVNRAVLVGTAIAAGQTRAKNDGVVIHTLWGELAWQLGGKEGYSMVADSDKSGTSPGSDILTNLLTRYSPCLVLIDEWVAYVRQMYLTDGLPGGSFDANMTFAQSLTEAAKATRNALVVASLPASDIEIGGEGGRHALDRLKNTFSRVESSWRPASAQEGFEIVRRRLFEPITEAQHFAERDAVLVAFSKMYQSNSAEFPHGCGEREYRVQMESAFPIHPELFNRLYNEWGSLDKFQRTRGVLRLMAAVIHSLWESGDTSLLIMPASVPVGATAVQPELTRYMSPQWDSIINSDVDGDGAIPIAIDRETPNLGRLSATRRVARTIYMGSAPTSEESNAGLDDRSVRLGCIQPGEPIGIFGDALRRLSDRATFLYADSGRYWYSIKANVTQVAADRATQIDRADVYAKLTEQLKKDRSRGDFAGVHVAPDGAADVPDEMEARLVVLGPEHVHVRGTAESSARKRVEDILANRGSSPRIFRNMLVFLAPDAKNLGVLETAVRQFMAWDSILNDRETLDLTESLTKQAKAKKTQAEDAITARIQETWRWCLAPDQPDPQGAIEWNETKVSGQDALAVRVSKKLKNDESLMTILGPARLKMSLDRYLWKNENHLNTKKLWEYCASYLYMPRLVNSDVLLNTIQAGIHQTICDHFAYAGRYNEESGRYEGLILTGGGSAVIDSVSVVVKPDVAQEQVEREIPVETCGETPSPDTGGDSGGTGEPESGDGESRLTTSFFGSVELDPDRLGRNAGQIAEEVLQHLSSLRGANVKIALEIHATVPDGIPDDTQRVVSENCDTLKFRSHGFAKE